MAHQHEKFSGYGIRENICGGKLAGIEWEMAIHVKTFTVALL